MTQIPLRLEKQLRFIVELDRLKIILRQTTVMDRSRRENSAEHSWHVVLMAVILAEHAPPELDLLRTMKMLLIHDVVEIDAGDAFCYDDTANFGKEDRERQAAERLFGVLPEEQAEEMRALWEEFEAGDTAEARFSVVIDRLQPLLQNHQSEGGTWRMHGVTRAQILRRMAPIHADAPDLWPVVLKVMDEMCAKGYVQTGSTSDR
ncbi:HD domain-containing protein [soil metagenome]